jgi:hypothetical protein
VVFAGECSEVVEEVVEVVSPLFLVEVSTVLGSLAGVEVSATLPLGGVEGELSTGFDGFP